MSNITEEIKSRLDIVEVLSEYIELKKAGANFKACCPFHQEKTASFVVSPERQIWHCFGCGAGSDIFGFVMKIEGIEFPEALRILAKKANVNLTNQNFNLTSARTNLLDITRLAAMFYQQNLLDSTAGQTARDYLKKRQVSDEIIKRFQLGYALDSWDNLLKFLIKKGISEKDIALAGLIIKKTTSNASTSDYYDRFRGRLMFPIADAYGNAVGFTGRVLPSEETNAKKETAKYVNTPETSIYHKGRILYGLDQAKETIRKNNYVIIVEGNMDVLAFHHAGIHNVVA
ncbi:MAG: DNA primase [Candidatus Aenigmarchaeota archaeon]|nr:DNA primase [Candidatus Aenigmarchaeota archaeon]